MKAIDLIRTGVLLLILGVTAPTYARQAGDPQTESPEQEAQNKQPQALGQQQQKEQSQGNVYAS
jgi:hypothetical protein